MQLAIAIIAQDIFCNVLSTYSCFRQLHDCNVDTSYSVFIQAL